MKLEAKKILFLSAKKSYFLFSHTDSYQVYLRRSPHWQQARLASPLPYRARAVSSPASIPGTATASPPHRASRGFSVYCTSGLKQSSTDSSAHF